MRTTVSAGEPVRLEAVIFDWGGTLTPWHDIDFMAEAAALAAAVHQVLPEPPAHAEVIASIQAANQRVWVRSRDHHHSATVADLFAEAGLRHSEDRLTAYREFWEPHTVTDPEVATVFTALRDLGLKIGILSNTVWPGAWHDEIFQRDGVHHLIDGAVYSSEIAHTKPAPEAFAAAMRAVNVTDPARAVFVGDRLFDDIWGAASAGMRTIHLPHSAIPPEQVGHSLGEPEAVVQSLAEIPAVVRSWQHPEAGQGTAV